MVAGRSHKPGFGGGVGPGLARPVAGGPRKRTARMPLNTARPIEKTPTAVTIVSTISPVAKPWLATHRPSTPATFNWESRRDRLTDSGLDLADGWNAAKLIGQREIHLAETSATPKADSVRERLESRPNAQSKLPRSLPTTETGARTLVFPARFHQSAPGGRRRGRVRGVRGRAVPGPGYAPPGSSPVRGALNGVAARVPARWRQAGVRRRRPG